MTAIVTRDRTINIRARSDQQALIDRAASIAGKNRTEFMLDSACQAALDVVLDQRVIHLSDADFEAFQTALDAPVSDKPELEQLMKSRAPWDKA